MFTTRNLFYLKISKDIVLPLHLYLDQQHVHWMQDYILMQVLRDLKPLQVIILHGSFMALEGDDLFEMGSKNPKASVDVVQEGYQFAFFFRKMEPHNILIKSRQFRMVPRTIIEDLSGSRAPETSVPKGRSNVGKRGKKRARTVQSDEDEEMLDEQAERPNTRRKIRRLGSQNYERDGQDGLEVQEPSESDKNSTYSPEPAEEIHLRTDDAQVAVKQEDEDTILPPASADESLLTEVNDDDEKSKLAMSLSYSGHHIPGRYLCVIVEPYPPLAPEQLPRATTVEPPEVRFRPAPAVPLLQGANSVPLSSRAGSVRFRSTTPLFLPEDDDEELAEIPSGRGIGQSRVLPPVPLFGRAERNEEDSDGEAGRGLLAFSQALAQVGHEEGGDDSDEDYLRGDADENPRMLD
ncbi:hypothetical protein CPB86DRAFT_762125 [Serendipita vermifera]|nr:hypothetical protein CPB86DRAFT_762125 [Serendipita vermifera]